MTKFCERRLSNAGSLALFSLFLLFAAVILFLSADVLQAQLTSAEVQAIAERNQQIRAQRLREAAQRRAANKKREPTQEPQKEVNPAVRRLIPDVNALNNIKPQQDGWSPSPFSGWNTTDLDDLGKETLAAIAAKAEKPAVVLNTQLHNGYYVNCVDPDSNAASAGLCRGDIIVFFNGNRCNNFADYKKWLKENALENLELGIFKSSNKYSGNSKIKIEPDIPENTGKIAGNEIVIAPEEVESLQVLDTNIVKERFELKKRLQNIKTEPLFTGSSFKKVLNAKDVFITKKFLYTTSGDIDDDVIPDQYDAGTAWKIPSKRKDDGGIEYDLSVLKNLLLRNNTFFCVDDKRLDSVRKIVSDADADPKERDSDLSILLESKVEVGESGLKYIKEVLALIADPVEQYDVRRQLLDGTVVLNEEKMKSIKEFLPLAVDIQERNSKLKLFLIGKLDLNSEIEKIKNIGTILSLIDKTQDKEAVRKCLLDNIFQFSSGQLVISVKCFENSPGFELRTDIDTKKKTVKCELFVSDTGTFKSFGFTDKKGIGRQIKFDSLQTEASVPVDEEMLVFIKKEENEFTLGNSKRTISAAESNKINDFLEAYNIFIKHNFTEITD